MDIDGFEEKPWKYPVVDTSYFFNFGFNEESWKDYCKQLVTVIFEPQSLLCKWEETYHLLLQEQLRLESTMQSKIRVYESGRAEQVVKCLLISIYCLYHVLILWYKCKVFHFSTQEYDPDLPPELAAAAGIRDVSSKTANPGKSDVGQGDVSKGSGHLRPPIVCAPSCIFI